MKENQVSYLRFARNLHPFQPARMAPALAFRRELLRGILRVVDQYIRSLSELPKILVKLRHARLIVGGVDHRAARSVHAIAQASLGMVQKSGSDLGAVDLPFVIAVDFMKFARRRHQADFHRKVRFGELRFKHSSKTLGAEVLRLEA